MKKIIVFVLVVMSLFAFIGCESGYELSEDFITINDAHVADDESYTCNFEHMHNCLAENDLAVTTIKNDDGFWYWLILCETCNTYALVYME